MKKLFSGFHMDRKLLFQFLIVFAAFFTMVIIGIIFGTRIVRRNIVSYGDEVIKSSKETLKAYLDESKITLDDIAFTVERLKNEDAGVEAMRREVTSWTTWMLEQNLRIASFIAAYGVVDGEFIYGTDWVPGDDYVPSSRPWYIGALSTQGEAYYCDPYIDAHTGEVCLTVSKLVFDENGKSFGVIAIDMYMDSIAQYSVDLRIMDSGYGLLLDSNRIIVAHPDEALVQTRLEDVNDGAGGYMEIASSLALGRDVEAVSFTAHTGEKSVAFFNKIDIGWYIGIVAPSAKYYSDVYMMIVILTVAGIVLAVLLCALLAFLYVEKQRSDEANKIKSSFLANMSHEIRTPMNAIIGMTDLLMNEHLTSRQQNYVTDISVSSHNLLAIINDILDLSKIEAGKLELNPVDYDFEVFIDNIASMFKFVSQEKGLDFIFETVGDMPTCLFGDDIRLRQVLTNICGNSVKFTTKGFLRIRVVVSEETVLFQIEDTGMGIRKEDLPKLFSPFAQADAQKNRNIVGTGLGLSISKNFIEMMKGEIAVSSVYGQGTVFNVTIPKVLGNENAIRRDEQARKEKSFFAPLAKVLLVDDNEVNLKVASGLLELYQIKANVALSGRAAIDMIKATDYDIVFMDHMMPEMDGVETTAEIRKMGGKFKNMTIIALTANAIHGAREMFMSNGFEDFISKPIDLGVLDKMLRTWLPPDKLEDREEISTPALEETQESAQPHDEFLDALVQIGGINTEIGLNHVTGLKDMYRETVELFHKKNLLECDKMDGFLAEKDLHNLSISVHGMKSALAMIGAMELSEAALQLENASKAEDLEFCEENLPDLLRKLREMHDKMLPIFPVQETAQLERPAGDPEQLRLCLGKVSAASKDFDRESCVESIMTLLAFDYGEQVDQLLENMKNAATDFDFFTVTNLMSQISIEG